jgi:hypothetical protein
VQEGVEGEEERRREEREGLEGNKKEEGKREGVEGEEEGRRKERGGGWRGERGTGDQKDELNCSLYNYLCPLSLPV